MGNNGEIVPQDLEALRDKINALPATVEKQAMFDFVAREKTLNAEFQAHANAIRVAATRKHKQVRMERFICLFLFVPLASFFAFHFIQGMFEGEIKNFIPPGTDWYFSNYEFPLVSFHDEQSLFCILAVFYALLAVAFGVAAYSAIAGITEFGAGRKSQITKAEFEARLKLAKAEQLALSAKKSTD
jgi:hypothetical protein